jgi:battenin
MIDSPPSSAAASKALRSFWLLGLLNNAPWVLMLAVATDIAAGGVALVFLANQLPGLLVKVTAPYWFHRASYRRRLRLASASTACACFLVGCGGWVRAATPDAAGRGGVGLALELLGVSFISFSCNLGEVSATRSLAILGLIVQHLSVVFSRGMRSSLRRSRLLCWHWQESLTA